MHRVTLDIPDEDWQPLLLLAEKEGRTVRGVIVRLLHLKLEDLFAPAQVAEVA
jgi:hypothetical protein